MEPQLLTKTMAVLSVAVLLLLGAFSSVHTGDLNMKSSEDALGDPCMDCTQILDLVFDILSNTDVQRGVMDSLEFLCDHLPNPPTAGKICRQQVERILPLAISYLSSTVDPNQVCSYMGLCGAQSAEDRTQWLASLLRGSLQDSLQDSLRDATWTLKLRDTPWLTDQSSAQCTYCMVLIDALQKMYPKEKTEGVLVHLLQGACGLLPASFQSQCEDLVEQFVRTVVDSLLTQATPKTVCSFIQLCSGQQGQLSRETAADPCSVQRSRCRDVRTALRCGALTFCRGVVWKAGRNIPWNTVVTSSIDNKLI